MKKELPTIDRIKQLLDYDPTTGDLCWKVNGLGRRGPYKPGDAAGYKMKSGYRVVCIDGNDYPVSRIAWFIINGEYPARHINFKDGNSSNTAASNLYISTFDAAEKSDYAKKRLASDPDYYRRSDLKSHFGLSLSDYEAMLVKQNGLCACCGKPETGVWKRTGKIKRLAVDHNHETGEVRDLLCSKCNPMIGYAQENIQRLRDAIKYLEKHSKIEKIITLHLVKEKD